MITKRLQIKVKKTRYLRKENLPKKKMTFNQTLVSRRVIIVLKSM